MVVFIIIWKNAFVFRWSITIRHRLAANVIVLIVAMLTNKVRSTTDSMAIAAWASHFYHAFVIFIMTKLTFSSKAFPAIKCPIVVLVIVHFDQRIFIIARNLFNMLYEFKVILLYCLNAIRTLNASKLLPSWKLNQAKNIRSKRRKLWIFWKKVLTANSFDLTHWYLSTVFLIQVFKQHCFHFSKSLNWRSWLSQILPLNFLGSEFFIFQNESCSTISHLCYPHRCLLYLTQSIFTFYTYRFWPTVLEVLFNGYIESV